MPGRAARVAIWRAGRLATSCAAGLSAGAAARVQEDTILFHLIERAQFKRNLCVYQSGAQFLEARPVPSSRAAAPPPPLPPVLTGHASSLLPY